LAAFRRRGPRGGGGDRDRGGRGRGTPGSRLLGKLRASKQLGLAAITPLERPPGAPDDVELATARRRGRPVAVVVGRRDGPDLLAWGQLAARLATTPVEEVVIACPLVSSSTRRLAETIESATPLRLVSAPSLADSTDALFDEDGGAGGVTWRPASGALIDRVLRVLEGAAIASGVGAVRETARGFVLYLRGVRVLEIVPEGDGVGIDCHEPERRHVHVSDANLERQAVELSELLARLARDSRFAERDEARRDAASDSLAAAVGASITARWLPWTADGLDPVDWVGIDGSGRAVIGLQRPSLGIAGVPAVLAARHRVTAERQRWAPGSAGSVRVVVASDEIDPRALELLESFDIDLEARPLEAEAASERGGRPRRRSRRRRRPRGEARPEDGAEETSAPTGAEAADAQPEERETALFAAETPEPRAAEEGEARAWTPDAEGDEGEPPAGAAREVADVQTAEGVAADAGESGDESEEPIGSTRDDRVAEAAAEEEAEVLDAADLEAQVTLAEEPEEAEAGEEPEVVEREKPRQRRQRAAIAVRNNADSILAALVLARERRHLVFFYVCGQEELMDFFRGKATDVEENADLLLVGFTAQPLPRETIASAELYRGRLEWFDHHDWAIEDLEALRDAIGRDSVAIAEGAASPLVPVAEIAERRSRFTDKLVDLMARRLSENDMEKWGYRLIGLIDRMRERSGDYRNEISPVLSGKPAELPEAEGTYRAEASWLDENDPRLVHFGEYQMAVLRVPESLDAGEIARRARIKTGARLSLSARDGDSTVLVACNDEKRHVNVMGLVDRLANRNEWTVAMPGGDRVGRLRIDDLGEHPERIEALIGEIVRHKSILYG